ncbi:hypothetical protein IJT10_07980 [bacterium]|nr:hypothetical protein [bacterium]
MRLNKYIFTSLFALSLSINVACGHNGNTYAEQSKHGQEQSQVIYDPYAVVEDALKNLDEMAQSGRPFNIQDEKWLKPLRQVLGVDYIEVPDLDNLPKTKRVACRLSLNSLTKDSVPTLRSTLRAMQAASTLKPHIFKGQDYTLQVFNTTIYNHLKSDYSSQDLVKIMNMLAATPTFQITSDPKTGLVPTTGMPEDENFEMAARQWVTDTVNAGQIQYTSDNKGWWKAVETLAKFYSTDHEQAAFDKAIKDPDSYRLGGPEEGVAHIFFPKTLERDPSWFNNKRLESHALALSALANKLSNHSYANPSKELLNSIANLTSYLVAIDYSNAPSAGCWEETPFPGGLTWDTQAANSALSYVLELIKDPKIQEKLSVQKHGEIFLHPEKIEQAIERGKKRVADNYLAESPGNREIDSSLAFMSEDPDAVLDEDPLQNVRKHIESLQLLEKHLVRDFGILRYAPFKLTLKDGSTVTSPDSYLNLNYNIACDKDGHVNLAWHDLLKAFGSKDASEPSIFAARASLSSPNCEAQWFMVSDLARAYTTQIEYLCDLQESPTPEAQELIKICLAGANRNLNRALARITPEEGMIKANGEKVAGWAVPEAWQCVSTIDGQKAYLPGLNSPLTWAKASLYAACVQHQKTLVRLEKLGML